MKATAKKQDVKANSKSSDGRNSVDAKEAAALEKLESYARKAAEGIRPYLSTADLDAYKRFLNMMYHYTLKSGEKLKSIANHSPNQELRDYFNHMYLEERNHYMLAKQDLKGFGMTPETQTPKEVQNMDKFWATLSEGHINGYLGALYVFENIADKVGDEVKAMLKRLNIQKDQRRWLSIHVEVDLDHGAEIKEVLQKYLSQDIDAAVNSAEIACDRWIEVSATPLMN